MLDSLMDISHFTISSILLLGWHLTIWIWMFYKWTTHSRRRRWSSNSLGLRRRKSGVSLEPMFWIEEIQLCQLCCLGDIALSGRYYHVSFCKQHSPTEILSLRLFSQEVGKRKWLSTFISQHVWHFLTWLLQDRDNWDTGLRCALVQTLVICLGVGIWLRDRGLVSWSPTSFHRIWHHLATSIWGVSAGEGTWWVLWRWPWQKTRWTLLEADLTLRMWHKKNMAWDGCFCDVMLLTWYRSPTCFE